MFNIFYQQYLVLLTMATRLIQKLGKYVRATSPLVLIYNPAGLFTMNFQPKTVGQWTSSGEKQAYP